MKRGDIVMVETAIGFRQGIVNYVRVRGPEVEAVSVILDEKVSRPGYAGTIFMSERVRVLGDGSGKRTS